MSHPPTTHPPKRYRRRLLIAFSGIVLVWAVLIAIDAFIRKSEADLPRFENKSIAEWLQEELTQGRSDKTKQAMDAMWPDSIPYLVETIKVEDGAIKQLYINLYNQSPPKLRKRLRKPIPAWIRSTYAMDYLYQKAHGWYLEDPVAKTVLESIRNMRPGPRRDLAFSRLKVLAVRLDDQTYKQRFFESFLEGTHFRNRHYCVTILATMAPETQQTNVPFLLQVLTNDTYLLGALAKGQTTPLGTPLGPFPNNKQYYQRQIQSIRQQSHAALRQIDPDLATIYHPHTEREVSLPDFDDVSEADR